MSSFVNIENCTEVASEYPDFDLIIIGSGAAGLTIARELSGPNIRIALLESGSRQESLEHETLNAVEASGTPEDAAVQSARHTANHIQLAVWQNMTQTFGIRCRVIGGSTAAWAGKVAPFDAIDFETRPWIEHSGWPVTIDTLAPYLNRAARHLDLGPLVQGDAFWAASQNEKPAVLGALNSFDPFFWQFARSRTALTDVMRFGPDFLHEHHENVTVFLNATVDRIVIDDGAARGVNILRSLSGGSFGTLRARRIVVAAGAIENARLLLLSPGADHGPVGQYLTDHPSVPLGTFSSETMYEAARIFGFYPLRQGYRSFMYAIGLALKPERQRADKLPNMAAFITFDIAKDDPLEAFKRLTGRRSTALLTDVGLVARNANLVISAVGKKILNFHRIPERIRRLMADIAVFLQPNMVAREFVGKGRGRRLNSVGVRVIVEQPPLPENRITLSARKDRLGIPLAHATWTISDSLRASIVTFGQELATDFQRAKIKGFKPDDALLRDNGRRLLIHDMAHTAGTTRMGIDPATSVVDADLAVHGVRGLYVAGASVFPTSGHANPTLVIAGFAIRLADHLSREIFSEGIAAMPHPEVDANRKLAVITGATGNLGRALVERFIEAGYRVRGQFRSTLPRDTRVEWVHCDFADPALEVGTLDRLVSGADVVIHMAASTNKVVEMQVANVTNLERLAQACTRQNVRYFGQASSMVVYGSPTRAAVDERAPLIDLQAPLERQYFAEPYMRDYAASKLCGEMLLQRFGERMHVDLYRIAVAGNPPEDVLQWGWVRRMLVLYRNTHYIAPDEVARAVVHLATLAPDVRSGVDVFNIADSNAPTYLQAYRKVGGRPQFHIPLLLDVVKNFMIARRPSCRRPMGAFRLDDRKLRETGFVHRR
ncbi:GMC oxidoreductase [Gluconobacter sp. OJB]|uniref:GMC oxidoreductase n=1 Tax=Gluconobacter sp. OJB TaxID=3145196 RepID=UPI0031F9AFB6